MCRKCREEAAKWRPFQDYFAFYPEPANQKPRLTVSGPRKDAKPSVNDKLRSYTVKACPKFGAKCCGDYLRSKFDQKMIEQQQHRMNEELGITWN